MKINNINERMIADYEERRNSLLLDGYRLRHESVLMNGVICRLHHMSNGNDIVIKAIGNKLTQLTNHVVTHQQNYEATPTMC